MKTVKPFVFGATAAMLALSVGCASTAASDKDDSSSSDAAVSVFASASSGSSKLESEARIYAAYSSKVKELIASYGQPRIETASKAGGVTYAAGLAYVDLVDFGDGESRLVVCYLDSSNSKSAAAPGAYPEDYHVQVWQFGEKGLDLAYSGTAQLDGQNDYCGALVYNDVDGKRYIEAWEGDYGGPSGNITRHLYGVNEEGKFGQIRELASTYSGRRNNYMLDGVSVSETEGSAAAERWFNYDNRTSIVFSSVKNNGQRPTKLIEDTGKVIAELEEKAVY